LNRELNSTNCNQVTQVHSLLTSAKRQAGFGETSSISNQQRSLS